MLFTKYIYDDKNNEEGSKDIKTTIFDIICRVESLMQSVSEKIETCEDEKLRNSYSEVYNQLNQYKIKLLNSANEIVNDIEAVDSLKREITHIENENMAQIIANIQEQDVNDISNENVSTDETEIDNDQTDEYSEKKEDSNIDEDVSTDEIQTEGDISNEAENDFSNDTENYNEINNEDVSEQSTSVFEQGVNEQANDEVNSEVVSEGTVPFVENENSEGVEEPTLVSEQDSGNIQGDVNPDVVSEKEGPVIESESNVGENVEEPTLVPDQDNVNVQNEVNSDVVSDAVVPVIEGEGNATENVEEAVLVPEQSVEMNENIQEGNSDTVSSEGEAPVIEPENNDNISVVEDGNVQGEINSENADINVGIQIPVITDSTESSENENSDVIRFKKNDAITPKAIIPNISQMTKLRESRDSQTAIIIASGLLKNDGNDEVSENQLIDNGLLPPEELPLEQQIEQMTSQATELYNAGKMDEAQALLNKVSELSQQNGLQKVA